MPSTFALHSFMPISLRRCVLFVAISAVTFWPSISYAEAITDAELASVASKEIKNVGKVSVKAYRATTHTQGATKTDTSVAETTQSVSVIGRDELDARGANNLNEAMRYVAGVSMESSGIDNRADDFSIRGFNAGSWGNNVTLDGMRAPQGSHFNRSMFDSWNLERVEALKGPSAVMYGQVAPGGLVNQVSKTPRPNAAQVLQIAVNGYGHRTAAFDFGTGTDDRRHLVRLVGLYRNGPTQIDQTSQQHGFIAPSYSLQLAKRTRLTLLGLHQRDRGGSSFQFLPMEGTLRPTQFGRIKNSTFLGEPTWNTYDRDIWTAGWMFTHAFNRHWTLSQSARRTNVTSLYRAVLIKSPLGRDGRTVDRRTTAAEGESIGDTMDTRLQGKFRTGALKHTILLGFDWQRANWNGTRTSLRDPESIDVFQPKYGNFMAVTTRIALYQGLNRQHGAYLQDQIAAGQWRFTAGGRFDWTDDHTASAIRSPSTGTDSTWTSTRLQSNAFTKQAGLLFVADNGLRPYVSYAESFQPVASGSENNFARKPFAPITGKQIEAGVKFEPRTVDGLLTLSAYDLRQQNILNTDPDPTHDNCGISGDAQCRVQNGEGRIRGIELEARITPIDGFSLIGAYSRMDAKVIRSHDGYLGKHMPDVPKWNGAIWGDYTFQSGFLRGLSLAAGARHNGIAFGDSGNLYRLPAYTLLDAAIRYDLGRSGGVNTMMSLNVSNITDKAYLSGCSSERACHYGTGRSINASARFSW